VRGTLARLWAISLKELLQLKRDRLTLAMMVALPVVQLTLFGYAIDTDVRHIPTVVYDQDRSAQSRDFARRMQATGFYDLAGEVRSYEEVSRAFRTGDARAALVVPQGYASELARGRPGKLQLLLDGSDPQSVTSASTAAAGVAQTEATQRPRTVVEPAILYNPNLETSAFIVPGLVGVILTMTMVMLTAMAIARERERGTLEQLIVSPLRRGELIVAKILPYVAMGYVQMTLILLLGRFIFGAPFRGSVPLLYLLAFVFIAANLAVGLFFSTLAKTQQQAMQMSFFFLLPNILLSGFMFPWEAMPRAAQFLSQVLPLTHFLRIVRGITLKGSGLAEVSGECAWLAGILVALVVLASGRFSKKLA
jgi:ABC-2 type transport system permease protein